MSKLQQAVSGFKAWCDEFVEQVLDHNGKSIWRDFDEQLGFLQDHAEPRAVQIPDIMTDEDAVKVIDEVLYRLKRCNKSDANPLCLDLHLNLTEMVKQWNLGTDPHSFASLPASWSGE
jgi:pyruvate-formate lyase-activating enzyme